MVVILPAPLLVVVLLNVLRCLAVLYGYTGFISRVLQRVRGLDVGGSKWWFVPRHDDSIWADGRGAKHSRRLHISIVSALALAQILETRHYAFTNVLPLVPLAVLGELVAESSSRGEARVENERYRWLFRTAQFAYTSWADYHVVSATPDHNAVWLDRVMMMKAFAALAHFVDFEEIAFEVVQPSLIATLCARYDLLAALVLKTINVIMVVVVIVVLQVRGAIWSRVGSGATKYNNSSIHSNGTRKKRVNNKLLAYYTRPTAVLAMAATTILAVLLTMRHNNKTFRDDEDEREKSHRFIGNLRVFGIPCLMISIALRKKTIGYFREVEERMRRYYEWDTAIHAARRRDLLFASLLSSVITLAFLLDSPLSLLLPIPLGFLAVYLRLSSKDRLASATAIAVRVAVLCSLKEFKVDPLMLFFLAGRLLLVFDHRPIFSQVWCESFFYLGMGIFASPRGDAVGTTMCALASIAATLFTALAFQTAEYQGFELMRMARESRAHLDHAVKQKLAGVSSALEHAMKTSNLVENNELYELLREAYNLTRRHHDACHLMNLAAIAAKPCSSSVSVSAKPTTTSSTQSSLTTTARRANDIVSDWGGRMGNLGLGLRMGFHRETGVSLDWNLAYYLLFTFLDDYTARAKARGGRKIEMLCECRFSLDGEEEETGGNNNNGWLLLSLERGFKWKTNGIKRRREVEWLVRALGAQFRVVGDERGSGSVLQIPATVVTLTIPPSPSATATTTTTTSLIERNTTIHPNCMFGILDDVALVRLATLSLFRREFRAHPDSFACGEKREDFDSLFLTMVRQRRPDVLVLDYYLDFSIAGEAEEKEEEEAIGTTPNPNAPRVSTSPTSSTSSSSCASDSSSSSSSSSSQMLGIEAARRCREEGFSGVILIHTANEEVRETVEELNKGEAGLVDGFLSKSFSVAMYERAIAEALNKRGEQQLVD